MPLSLQAWSAKNQVAAGKYLNLPEDIPVDAFPLRSTDNNDFVGLPPHCLFSLHLPGVEAHLITPCRHLELRA